MARFTIPDDHRVTNHTGKRADGNHNSRGSTRAWPKLPRPPCARSAITLLCNLLLSSPAMIPRPALSRQLLYFPLSLPSRRFLSAISPVQNAGTTAPGNIPARPHGIDPRWLTMMKRRVGKCMMFGLNPAQVDDAGKVLQQLARDWRELIAGSEGFLTDEKRRGLYRQNVVWGEMVRIWTFRNPVDRILFHIH